ncbi:hypothetical protein ACWCPI_10235 [Streptomyces sp. NPDC001920]
MSSSPGRLTHGLRLQGGHGAGRSVARRAVRAGVMPERVFAVADALVDRWEQAV